MRMQAKIIGLEAAGALLALAIGYLFSAFLSNFVYGYLLASLILAIFWLVYFVLRTIFIDNRQYSFWLFIDAFLMVMPALFIQFSFWLLILALLTAILWLAAYTTGRKRLDNSLKLNLTELRRHMLPTAAMAAVLFFIGVYIIALGQGRMVISKKAVELIILPFQPAINYFLTDFSINDRISDFWLKVVGKTSVPLVNSRQAAREMNRSFNQLLDVKVKMEDSFIDAVYNIITEKFQQISERGRFSVLATVALILLFVASGVTYFINFVVIILAWAFYHLLLITGFGYIQQEKTNKEVVKL